MNDEQDSGPALRSNSAGAILRQAREEQGVHIAALAASIKVAPRKLDALENDRWSELPDATFTRALAQTVCRTLKIDAKPVLELLPALGQSTLDRSGSGLGESRRERGERGDPAAAGSAVRPMVWAAAGLMVAALGLYFFPRGDSGQPRVANGQGAASAVALGATTPAASVPSTAPAASVAAAAASAAASATVPTDNSLAAGAGNGAPTATAPVAAGVEVEPVVAAKLTPASAGVAANTPATSTATSPVQPQLSLSASRAAWVDVRDSRGQVLISRTLSAGETVGLEGTPPLRVAIGNAAAVQLVFRGQPVELAARARENVARFELQ